MATTLTERVLAYAPGREADLWRDYLDVCRRCGESVYEEVEPWAWRRLQAELRLLPKGQT